MDSEYRKKLQSLGVYFGSKELKDLKTRESPTSKSLPGIKDSNSMGDFFYCTKEYPNNYKHGLISFEEFLNPNSPITIFDSEESTTLSECIFLDTETTGLAISGGTFAFMVGIGWYEKNSFSVRQYFLEDPGQEAAMLLDLENFLANFKTIITYNGISFDIPILKSRYRYHRMPNKLSQKFQLDLLKYARMYFKYQFESRSLKSMEINVLQYQRSEEEIPGYLAPILYNEYLKSGETENILGVFYHNEIDVVSLAALLNIIIEISNKNDHYFLNYETLDFSIARQHERKREYQEAIEHYSKALSHTKLSDSYRLLCLLSLANLSKKLNQFDNAIEYYKLATSYGNVDSFIELAKIYEHKKKKFSEAIDCCKIALLFLDNDVDSLKSSIIKQQIDYRLARLKDKAENEKI